MGGITPDASHVKKIMFFGCPPFFSGTAFSRMEYDAWDVSHDDKRFLMLKRQEAVDGSSMDEARPKIDIVVNWFEELKGMAPVK